MKKCKSCKSEIDAKATKCPHCQADQRSWFRRHPILTGLLVLFVIGIIGSAAGGSKNSNNSSSTSATTNEASNNTVPAVKPTPIVVDATTLVKDYDKNKLAAQDKYTGKVVQTTAFIKNISDDITGSYYLSLNPSSEQYYFGTTIACYFADKSQKSQLTSLSNGQSITVQGKMDDMSLGIVVMKECNLTQ